MPRPFLLLFALLAFAGCLPSSCQREEPRALLPADSLSRQRAAAVPMDTMRLAWRTSGDAAHPLAYPRTVAFAPDGRLYVADVSRNSLLVFSSDGAFAEEVAPGGFEVPYLAGFRGDTVVVFNAAALRLDFVAGGTVARHVAVEATAAEGALVYAAALDSALFFKQVGEEAAGYVARLGEDGRVVERVELPPPYWRYAGLLRPWDDALLSLSGYRPVVDILATAPLRRDTLALQGFDSPMLARSRTFMLGQTGEAPLLSSAAAAAGDLLFVLNLRPGWLQVDAYDRRGVLRHRLTQDAPSFLKEFFPQDLAVRRRADGGYDVAVVFKDPAPRLDLYRF